MFPRSQKERVHDAACQTLLDASPKLIAGIVGYALGEKSVSSHLEWRSRLEPPTLSSSNSTPTSVALWTFYEWRKNVKIRRIHISFEGWDRIRNWQESNFETSNSMLARERPFFSDVSA